MLAIANKHEFLNEFFGTTLSKYDVNYVFRKLEMNDIDLDDADEVELFLQENWRIDTKYGTLINDGFAVTSDDGEWGFFHDLSDAIEWLESNNTDATEYKEALEASLNGDELPLDIFSVWTHC